jgi:hypothetical protein
VNEYNCPACLLQQLSAESPRKSPPKIVCLCGSTRFMDRFFEVGWTETLAGNIVLGVGVCKYTDASGGQGGEVIDQDVADALDALHLRKIDMADEVIIIRVNGYVGLSTGKELAYAQAQGKPIRYVDFAMVEPARAEPEKEETRC